jgi:hypothetical protein
MSKPDEPSPPSKADEPSRPSKPVELSADDLVQGADTVLKTFGDEYVELHKNRIRGIKKWTDCRGAEVIKKNTLKTRAKTILTDIWRDLDDEVFILCALSTTLTVLGTMKSEIYVLKLKQWWKDVKVPAGLKETAKQLAAIPGILPPKSAKRKREAGDGNSGQSVVFRAVNSIS